MNFDENKQPVLNSEIANAIDDAVASHVNNKLSLLVKICMICLMIVLAELKYILV